MSNSTFISPKVNESEASEASTWPRACPIARGQQAETPSGNTSSATSSQSITGALKVPVDRAGLRTGGEDTAEVFCFVDWSGIEWDLRCARLQRLKELAQAGSDAHFEAGGESWAVEEKGFRVGEQKSGTMYSYVLKNSGVVFGLQKRERPTDAAQVGNVKVQIGSEFLMVMGGLGPAWVWVQHQIMAMGGRLITNKLSSVHACADLPGADIMTYYEDYDNNACVGRPRRWSDYTSQRPEAIAKAMERPNEGDEGEMLIGRHGKGARSTGFTYGVYGMMVRVYDKLTEVKSDAGKYAVMQETRWGGEVENAVRVEYEMHREALLTFRVDMVEDWLLRRAEILSYLTYEWFRMVKVGTSRENTSRAPLTEGWQKVRDAFAGWAGTEDAAERVKVLVKVNVDALVRQARGCITSALAYSAEGYAEVMRLMRQGLEIETNRKRIALAARRPTFAYRQYDPIPEWVELE